MRAAVVAALCWPVIGWALWRFGPTAVAWGLPAHEVVTRLLLGSAFELSIHPVSGTANTLEMNVHATRRALTCGAGLVVPGDAWRVHTSLFHVLQQWWIALAALTACSAADARLACRWALRALPTMAVVQLVTLPVLLAAGVLDVTCAHAELQSGRSEPSLVRVMDAVLQNGGLWFTTLVVLAASFLAAREQPQPAAPAVAAPRRRARPPGRA